MRRLVYLAGGVVLMGVLTIGCSVFHPWGTDRTVEGTYTQVFQATLEVLEAREFPIEKVDRAEGRIETGKRPVSGVGPPRPVESVRADVNRDDGEVSVRLFMTFVDAGRDREDGPFQSETTSPGDGPLSRSVIYDDYLDAIEARVADYEAPAR